MNSRAYYLTTFGEWKRNAHRFASSHWVAASPSASFSETSYVLALIEGDESVHAALELHPGFAPLPHPLSNRPVPEHVAERLAEHGVLPGATTFDVAEAVARAHPLLRHRVF